MITSITRAFVFWRPSKYLALQNDEERPANFSSVIAHAFTMAGDRLVVVPSKIGAIHPLNPLMERKVMPQPFQMESVELIRKASSIDSEKNFYVAYPIDGLFHNLPGLAEPMLLQLPRNPNELIHTIYLEGEGKRHLRIFRSSRQKQHGLPASFADRCVPWEDAPSLWGKTVPCWIWYIMARDNRPVGYAFLDASALDQAPLPRVEVAPRLAPTLPRVINVREILKVDLRNHHQVIAEVDPHPSCRKGYHRITLRTLLGERLALGSVSKGYLEGLPSTSCFLATLDSGEGCACAELSLCLEELIG